MSQEQSEFSLKIVYLGQEWGLYMNGHTRLTITLIYGAYLNLTSFDLKLLVS